MIDLLPKYAIITSTVEEAIFLFVDTKPFSRCGENSCFFSSSPNRGFSILGVGMKKCKVKGCKQKYRAKGYCNKHYQKWKKWGNPLIIKYYFPTPELIAAKMKRCTKCKEIKSLTEFYQDKNRKDKHCLSCKKCHKKNYIENRERIQIRKKELYGKNKEKIKERWMNKKKKYNGLYGIWRDMKNRCFNPNGKAFNRYGGRGITVCKEWQNSFQAFYEWAKDKHRKRYQIDRRNNDGNYCPENCRFITQIENIRNCSATKLNVKKVKEIKILLKENKLTHLEIGKMFGVRDTAITKINTRKTWTNING